MCCHMNFSITILSKPRVLNKITYKIELQLACGFQFSNLTASLFCNWLYFFDWLPKQMRTLRFRGSSPHL